MYEHEPQKPDNEISESCSADNKNLTVPDSEHAKVKSAPTQAANDSKHIKKLSKSNKRKRQKAIVLQLQAVSLLLVLVFVIGLIFPLRPSVSELEKRELTKFPKFSVSSFMDGSFFSELELWYADTFPMREWLLNLNTKFESFFGIKGEQFIGEQVNGDDIPSVDTAKGDFGWMTLPLPGTQNSSSDLPPMTDSPISDSSEATGTTEKPVTALPPVTDNSGSEEDPNPVVPEKHGSVYLLEDTAFELYGFSRTSTDRYISMVNQLANQLNGQSTVYSVIAPLSYGINLSESVQNKMGASNENDALIYIYSELSEQVRKVYTFQNLMAHKSEYLYFRTDHHWTALGAYYAYEVFCAQKGITPTSLSAYQTQTYSGFLGSLYASCNSPAAMKENPDTVIAYKPLSTNSMVCYQKDGTVLNWNIITNVDGWNASSKYSTFIGGDNPYSEIHNPNKTDGSSCVVVKNSYGNAFVPFLVDHYEYVYVVDFRYYDAWSKTYNNGLTFRNLIKQKNIQDVLIVTNITATGSSTLLDSMEGMFTK